MRGGKPPTPQPFSPDAGKSIGHDHCQMRITQDQGWLAATSGSTASLSIVRWRGWNVPQMDRVKVRNVDTPSSNRR